MLLGQLTHALAALAPDIPEYVPALQFAHAADELAPVVVENVPALQLVHTLAPASEYTPAAQVIHTLALLAAGTFEYVPAVQSVHTELPMIFLNLPGTQAVQAPPSGPVYPVLHLQSEIDFVDVANGEFEFVGHAIHCGSEDVTETSYKFKLPVLKRSISHDDILTSTYIPSSVIAVPV